MEVLEVGKVVPGGLGHEEGTKIDIDDGGATLVVYFDSPTEQEIAQFKKNFEIRFTILSGVAVFTFKIGNLNWMDAPYSVHLSKNLTKFIIPDEGEGLSLQLMLVDTRTGILKSMRLLGLSTSFTRKLFGKLMEQKTLEFNKQEYLRNVQGIMQRYDTKDIVKLSNTYCKFS